MTSVLHVLRRLDVSGVELVALELASWATRHGIASSISAEDGPLVARIPPEVALYERAPGSFAQLVFQVVQHTRESGAVILHAHQRREALACLMAAKLLRRTAVEHAHNVIPSRRARMLSFRSAHIFAVAEPVARMVKEDFGREQSSVHVVQNVPVQARPDSAPRSQGDNTLRLVAIGRVHPQKDPERFIRVVNELAAKTTVRARWIGDGPQLHDMRKKALGVPCDFAGPSDDVASELSQADALVMTSAWEGLPLVVLEALAVGTPVIATAVGGLPELLEAEGAGVVVEQGCSDATFAEAVFDATRPGEQRDARVARGQRLVETSYHPEAAFGDILRVYKSVGSSGSAAG